jgi:hypothetical protein
MPYASAQSLSSEEMLFCRTAWNDSGVRILHAARALRKAAVGH